MLRRAVTMMAAVLISASTLWAAVEAPLTVTDAVGVARKAEPVSTGVCFKLGEVKDVGKLALFTQAGQPVPAQFDPLVTCEDGSIQWVLVSFLADCPANGSAGYVVKDSGNPAKPAQPLKVSQADGVTTFDNGKLQVVVDAAKPVFDLISSVKVDGKAALTGAAAEAMTCRDAFDNNKQYHAGRPTRVAFDYNGPVRSTLMLEGPYVDESGKEWLGYRVRVTCFAGSPLVRIEHSLRNSCPTEARNVKVKDAYLRFALAGKAADAATSGDSLTAGGVFAKHRLLSGYFSSSLHELAVRNGKMVLGVVPLYEGEYDSRGHLGYNKQEKKKDGSPANYGQGDTGSWWLIDCAYKIDEYWLGFDGGDAELAKGLDSRLYALAPADYYSECEALGFGKFGNLEDEANTYKAWGWKNVDEKKARLLGERWLKAQPGYHVPAELVHDETETDDAEGMLLMALRTGGRGYFDGGLAWARYYTNNFVPRIDFDAKTKRGPGPKWDYQGRDFANIVRYGTSYGNGRTCGCHFYGGGALDYYCLTGEKSLLLGATDLVNVALRNYGPDGKREPGKTGVTGWGSRAFGRQFMAVVRMYQVLRTEQSKKNMQFMAELVLNDPNYIKQDDYGFLHSPGSNGVEKKHCTTALKKYDRLREYMEKKGLTWNEGDSTVSTKDGKQWNVYDAAGSWEQTYVQQGIHRYWKMTGDEKAAEYVKRFANFFRKLTFNEHCQQAGYRLWGVNFPEVGMCLGSHETTWNPAHDKCPEPGAKHDGWYTTFGPDVAMRAYEVTGDKKYLADAKLYWDRGSKRGYQSDKWSAGPDEVGRFAVHIPPKNDDILSTALMFYYVPRLSGGK